MASSLNIWHIPLGTHILCHILSHLGSNRELHCHGFCLHLAFDFTLTCFSITLAWIRSAIALAMLRPLGFLCPCCHSHSSLFLIPSITIFFYLSMCVCACMHVCLCVCPCICYIVSTQKKSAIKVKTLLQSGAIFGPYDFKGLFEGWDLVSRSRFRIGWRSGGLDGMIRVRVGSWVIYHVYESPNIDVQGCVSVWVHTFNRNRVRVRLSEALAVLHHFDVEHCWIRPSHMHARIHTRAHTRLLQGNMLKQMHARLIMWTYILKF